MNLLLLNPDEISANRAGISGRRARHAIQWLKAKPGTEIRAGVINGKVGRALVTAASDTRIELELSLSEMPPAPREVTLILALPRPKVFGRIIQAVTSLGIKRVAVCNSYRVEKAYWSAHQITAPWVERQIFLGLEQAGDTVWPHFSFHRRLRPFVEDELNGFTDGHRKWIAHPGAAGELLPSHPAHPVALAIGPEGGWIPFEIELFGVQGFKAGRYGAHILKCETAIPAMIGHLSGCGEKP